MANYAPYKDYFLFCLDKIIDQHGLQAPFLDVGCGSGDTSEHLACRGWAGKAIDFSDVAIVKAQSRLEKYVNIEVTQCDLGEVSGRYSAILLMDVLEHVEDDAAVLGKISALLPAGGCVVLTVPSNPREWRWDDDVYGHLRRYSRDNIVALLVDNGLRPEVVWDVSLPVFWLMRRMYTRLARRPKLNSEDSISRTKVSTAVNAWGQFEAVARVFTTNKLMWTVIHKISFGLFRKYTRCGSEMMIMARKV